MSLVAITHVAWRGPYLADAPPLDEPLASPRARKMMSRSAYVAALALADLMRSLDVTAETRAEIGYFLGVGGSAGSLDDVTALLDASIVDDAFSLRAFGDRGLAACNPLLAFQLMNNFTMCHGAILENLGGPNSALFSRGAGTIAAIEEARHAVASGECSLAIAGGADVGTHAVTLAELARDGRLAARMVPADAAALLALAPSTSPDDVVIEGCAHASGRDRSLGIAIEDAVSRACRAADTARPIAPDLVVLAPWGPPAADALRSFAARFPTARVIDACEQGDAIAASPALALIAAVQALRAAPGIALVVTLGVDGDPGAVVLSRRGGAS
ncbi:MAG: beta-ketoacyl synthase N-terminal-like domain-containing protein [Kofleriaceae bacterium]